MIFAGRTEFGQVRCPLADFIDCFQRETDARFAGNCRQVQNGIGAAAQCHIHGKSIFQRFLIDDIARPDIFRQQRHYLFPGFSGQMNTSGISRRDRAVPR